MKKYSKYINYLILFIVFIVILSLSPICGDDWGNYPVGKLSLYHIIGNAYGMYLTWEGRIVSRILINLLTYRKILWNITNSFLIVSLIYLINRIINPKHKKIISIMAVLLILMMNIFTFSQVVVWVAGNLTYLFVLPFILLYFYLILNNKTEKKYIKILLGLLSFGMTLFVEHMAAIIVAGNILIIINRFIKEKKINKELIIYLILSIVGTLLILLSPGNAARKAIEHPDFNKLPFYIKIINNIPNFIYYTFIINPYYLILSTITLLIVINKHLKNKIIKILLYLFSSIIPLLTIICYINQKFGNNNFTYFSNVNTIVIIYYILETLLLIYFIFKYYSKKEIVFFFVLGLLANGAMMFAPTWGPRTSFATYLFMSMSMLMIIDINIKDSTVINIVLTTIMLLFISAYLILYISIYRQYIENLNIIDKYKKGDTNVLTLVCYPYYINADINPEAEYHKRRFKEYYDLKEETIIEYKPNNWKYYIFYRK